MEGESRELNVLFHPWAFPDIPFEYDVKIDDKLPMACVEPLGVTETNMNLDPLLNGLPLHRLEPRLVEIHNMRFSPQNAQVKLLDGAELHMFGSICVKQNKTVITYHIMAGTAELQTKCEEIITQANSLADLLTAFQLEPALQPITAKILRITAPMLTHSFGGAKGAC